MRDIKMVDLNGQYLKIKSEVDEAIKNVIDTTSFIKGPDVTNFEKSIANYLNVNHAISCGNGTDALQIAMMALGLKPGDEVITTNFTFVATVEVIALLGLKLVLVDVDPNTFNIDTAAVENAISDRTKAIVPVHLFGQCADMESIMRIAKKHNLFVIEDNAQAIGSDYLFSDGTSVKSGTIGDIGCTSFFPSKNLGAYGDGGALFTNDSDLANQISYIVNHGMKERYYHDYVGVNSRLDTIQAAILNIKLKRLDEYCRSRMTAAQFYDNAFADHPNLQIPTKSDFSSHVYHQYTLKVINSNRDMLHSHLLSNGIPCAIYYPVPLHVQKAYLDLGYKNGDFPVTEDLCKCVISLPMHTELDSEQLEYISENLLGFFKEN